LPRLLVNPYLPGVRKRYPITLAGVLGVALRFALCPVGSWWITAPLALLCLTTPISQLPFVPWSIRLRIGDPIEPDELFAGDDLDSAYQRAQDAVQSLVR
jgi:hypothetical protein